MFRDTDGQDEQARQILVHRCRADASHRQFVRLADRVASFGRHGDDVLPIREFNLRLERLPDQILVRQLDCPGLE